MRKFFRYALIAVAAAALHSCKPEPAKEPQQPSAQSNSSSIAQDVGNVVDYGIGAAQLKAKQRATTKIQEAQDRHNRELEAALQE